MKFYNSFLSAITLLFFSCHDGDTTQKKLLSQQKTFSDTNLHLEFSYPKNWMLDSSGGQIILIENKENKEDNFQENISIWTELMPMHISDSTYMRTAIGMIKIKNPDMIITQKDAKKIGAFVYYPFAFSFNGRDSINNHIIGYAKVEGTRGYNFMCNTTVSNKEKYQPIFEKILATFKPL